MTRSGFLGVLGGMGPLATADFLRKLAANSSAHFDQDHIPVLLYGDCTTPDRTSNIEGIGPSPLPKLLDGIRFLNQAGVRAICIPCNSAHHWFSEMEAASRAPLIHIGKACAAQVQKLAPQAKAVGVLSTLGTHLTGLYQNTLFPMGYEILSPSKEEFETLVSPGISFVKSNQLHEGGLLLVQAATNLLVRGAEIIILGCTEIPIGLKNQCDSQPLIFIDSTDALALAVLDAFSPNNQ